MKRVLNLFFVLTAVGIVSVKTVAASDIETILNSKDGSTEFAVKDSDNLNVATIDSDGNLFTIRAADVAGGYVPPVSYRDWL